MTTSDQSTVEQAQRRRAGRSPGRILLAAVLGLAVSAASVLVLTDEPRWLRLGVVAALWAALVGAFAAARYRREVLGHTDRSEELRRVYELELEREVAARREYELEVETSTRRRVEQEVRNEVRDELNGLRTLRQNLEALLGGEVLVERVALRAESTRLRSLSDQSRAARSGERALPQGRAGHSDRTKEWTPEADRAFAADAEVLSARAERPDAGSAVGSWSAGSGAAAGSGASRPSADERTDVLARYRPRSERIGQDLSAGEPPLRSGPAGAEPVRAEPMRAEPMRAEPIRAEPIRAEPIRAEPARRARERHEPSQSAGQRNEQWQSARPQQSGSRQQPVPPQQLQVRPPAATPPPPVRTWAGPLRANPPHTEHSFADPSDTGRRPFPVERSPYAEQHTASYDHPPHVDPPWAAELPRPDREPAGPDPLGVDPLPDESGRYEPTPAWERFDSWTPAGTPQSEADGSGDRRRDGADFESGQTAARRRTTADEPAGAPSSTGGRRRAPEPEPAANGYTSGRRRLAEPDPALPSSSHTGGQHRVSDAEPPASPSSTGGRRRAAEETAGSHASGRSVGDLLASFGDPAEPRHRRRRQA